jgi:hypothetical protein
MLSAVDMPPGFVDARSPWLWGFSIGCYVSMAACLFFTLRLWRGGARKAALAEAGLLLLLVGFFFALESFGQVRIPFYSYPKAFWDSRAPLPFSTIPWLQPTFVGERLLACIALVRDLPLNLPLSIPLMEASLAFAALWTARLLGASRLGLPMLTGLAALLVDSALDPVVATSFAPPALAGDRLVQLGHGLGLWRWVVFDGLGPDSFGIPLINYGVWFAGTVILVCLIELLRKVGGWDHTIHARCLNLPSARTTPRAALGLWGLLFVACIGVIALSPELSHLTTRTQRLLFYGTVVGALVHFVRTARVSPRRADIHWELLVPLLFFLLFPVSYLIASGLFWTQPLLLVSTALYVTLGMLYCLGPYVPRGTRGTPSACVGQPLRTSFASMAQGRRTDQC